MRIKNQRGSERAWLAQPIASREHAARTGLYRPAPTRVTG